MPRPRARPRPEDRLLAELASWGGTFRPGLERQGVVRTDDGLEVEITIRVRKHTGAAQAAELRAKALAYLRESPFASPNALEAERCGCYLRNGGRCEGERIVAVVVYGAEGRYGFRFICGRHRQAHGIDPRAVAGVVELPEHTLAEAKDLARRWRAGLETERRALELAHRQGAHGLLPAGITLAKRCPVCEDLEHELAQCRSHSPTSGRRCREDVGHAGPHRGSWAGGQEWSS